MQTNTYRSKTILLIDDDGDIARLVEKALQTSGYALLWAKNWTEAITVLANRMPALVLLDLKMPTVEGDSILKFIREQGQRVPVLVLSAHINDQTTARLSPLGIAAFVKKPFDAAHLIQTVEDVLSSNRPGGSTRTQNPNARGAWDRQMEHLRKHYLNGLNTRIRLLESARKALLGGQAEAEDTIRQLAHTLAGSGKTYGFPAITKAALEVERSAALDLAARLDDLIAVLSNASNG